MIRLGALTGINDIMVNNYALRILSYLKLNLETVLG